MSVLSDRIHFICVGGFDSKISSRFRDRLSCPSFDFEGAQVMQLLLSSKAKAALFPVNRSLSSRELAEFS